MKNTDKMKKKTNQIKFSVFITTVKLLANIISTMCNKGTKLNTISRKRRHANLRVAITISSHRDGPPPTRATIRNPLPPRSTIRNPLPHHRPTPPLHTLNLRSPTPGAPAPAGLLGGRLVPDRQKELGQALQFGVGEARSPHGVDEAAPRGAAGVGRVRRRGVA